MTDINDLSTINIMIDEYRNEMLKNHILYISESDVEFENEYNRIASELLETDKIRINKKQPEIERCRYISELFKETNISEKGLDNLKKLAILCDKISYFKTKNIYSNHQKKRIRLIYNLVSNEPTYQIYKEKILYDTSKIEINEITSITSYLKIINNLNITFYRGHSNLKYKLLPSIYRNDLINYETKLYKEMLLKFPEEFEKMNSSIEMLSKLQHYECPTRLLDITTNPLVALYFSCCSNYKDVGEVIFFKVDDSEIKYNDSDKVSIIANISKINEDFEILNFKDKEIDEFNNSDILLKLHHEIKQEKPYFKPIIQYNDIEKTYFIRPKMTSKRMIKQDGCFIIFGIKGRKANPAEINQLYSSKGKIQKYLITDKKIKMKIMKDLDTLSFNHASLFPEIDKYSNYLVEKYRNLIK